MGDTEQKGARGHFPPHGDGQSSCAFYKAEAGSPGLAFHSWELHCHPGHLPMVRTSSGPKGSSRVWELSQTDAVGAIT